MATKKAQINMDIQFITVELSPRDAELFKFFQKNYTNIKQLENKGVFELKAKTVHLHLDPKGTIKDVDFILRCL